MARETDTVLGLGLLAAAGAGVVWALHKASDGGGQDQGGPDSVTGSIGDIAMAQNVCLHAPSTLNKTPGELVQVDFTFHQQARDAAGLVIPWSYLLIVALGPPAGVAGRSERISSYKVRVEAPAGQSMQHRGYFVTPDALGGDQDLLDLQVWLYSLRGQQRPTPDLHDLTQWSYLAYGEVTRAVQVVFSGGQNLVLPSNSPMRPGATMGQAGSGWGTRREFLNEVYR